MKRIKEYEDCAHACGQLAARQTHAAIYGTRFTPDTNAGTAPDRQTFGRAIHSVWQGPRQTRNGAPILRRDH